ncbi:MAG: alanine racemase [Cyanobacteria bacterium]|nr:alanine racemase [Cyanobacteriota bacterium]
MKLSRAVPTQTRRDAWIEVDLGALEHNTRVIRQSIQGDVALMAIVKADAYGHGAVMCIPTLEASGVRFVGVASMDEALSLRQAGVEIPILVIGAIPDWSVQMAITHDIQLTVFAYNHLESLKAACQLSGKPVKVHIKVDTGMNRIGVDYREALSFIQQCVASPFLQIEGIFTHLACSEDPDITQMQYQRWEEVLSQLDFKPPYLHFGNSLGALGYPDKRFNMVRIGIGFYGYLPEADPVKINRLAPLPSLKPVMGLKARIMRLHHAPPASGVSYSYSYKTPPGKDTLIATLPLGYADGVPRLLSNRLEGFLRGVRVKQIGNITMDQMMFDVSDVPDACVGDTLTLLGSETTSAGVETITLSHWASAINTLEYELMCGLRVRLPKTYTRS